MRGKEAQRRYAKIMVFVLLGMAFLPYLYLPGKVYGAVSFGGGEISYSEELVALFGCQGRYGADGFYRTYDPYLSCAWDRDL